DKHFLVDTGGYDTTITTTAAQDLGLPITGSLVKRRFIGGLVKGNGTVADTFQLGDLVSRNMPLGLDPVPGTEKVLDGLIGIDLLLGYDVDLDFGHDKMHLISSDHCAGKVVYWPAQSVAEVPMRIVNGHYLINVTLEGHPLVAMVDTGAFETVMGAELAHRLFGLDAASPDMQPAGKLNGLVTSYKHKFAVMSFEGIEIHNATIGIAESPMLERERYATGARVIRGNAIPWDIILGMDMMRHLHLYIATQERKIYITPAQ
ncbi:MAG TPA: aspartyl protease family protein, partial [Rhizomicrobium sp.]|nr:aspartyl protease family protein [Rhizomicrobium sp.]